jgi:DNA mismatch repair protein MSH5
MRELDTVLGDIHGLISDREIEIMHQLSEKILEYGTMLVKTCDLTAELDW